MNVRLTATEVRAAAQEKQAKWQQLVHYVTAFDRMLLEAAFIPNIFQPLAGGPPKPEPKPDPFPGPPEDEPCEVGFGSPIPQPDTATPVRKRGKLHQGAAAFEVSRAITVCHAGRTFDGHPPRFLPQA